MLNINLLSKGKGWVRQGSRYYIITIIKKKKVLNHRSCIIMKNTRVNVGSVDPFCVLTNINKGSEILSLLL